MGCLHLLTFMMSLLANLVASDCVASISKAYADPKSKLFRRLTVLQCRIAICHNLLRLPLMARLFFWDYWNSEFVEQTSAYFVSCHLASIFTSTGFPKMRHFEPFEEQ